MIAEEPTKIEETVDSIKDYLNTRYELATLKAADKVAHLGSNTLSFLPIMFLSVLTVLMLSVGLAIYIGQVMESNFAGFFVMGGAYLLIVLILIASRKSALVKPMRNKIIRELFNTNNHIQAN